MIGNKYNEVLRRMIESEHLFALHTFARQVDKHAHQSKIMKEDYGIAAPHPPSIVLNSRPTSVSTQEASHSSAQPQGPRSDQTHAESK